MNSLNEISVLIIICFFILYLAIIIIAYNIQRNISNYYNNLQKDITTSYNNIIKNQKDIYDIIIKKFDKMEHNFCEVKEQYHTIEEQLLRMN